jgi:hypothetical protein
MTVLITIAGVSEAETTRLGHFISDAISRNRDRLWRPRSLLRRLRDAFEPDRPFPNIGTQGYGVGFKYELLEVEQFYAPPSVFYSTVTAASLGSRV